MLKFGVRGSFIDVNHTFLIWCLLNSNFFLRDMPGLYGLNFRIFAWNNTTKQENQNNDDDQNTASNAYTND